MENVRLGIVGCGKIAEHCHIPAVLSSANVEVVAIVDSNPTRLEFIVRSFSLSCLAASSPSVLKGRVDAVLLLLPNYLHASVGCEFLQNGIHVLCEKPLANTTKEARMMCEAAEGNGALLAVGYMSRFYPSVQLMKRLLEERFLGQLEHFEYEYGGTGGWETISNYNLYRNQAGGGVLTANGSHFFDRMLFWFGYPSIA